MAENSATDYALQEEAGNHHRQGYGNSENRTSGALSFEEAKRAVTGAASFVGESATAIGNDYIQEIENNFRVLVFVGAPVIVVTSVLDILRGVLYINLTHIMISVIVCCFSVIICILEMHSLLPDQLQPFQSKLYEHVNFLRLITGRGYFYFFTGLLQFSLWSLLNMISGGFMMFVGLLYVIVGNATGTKLASVRAAIKDETTLQVAFADNDTDDDGYLMQEDFENMIKAMELDLSQNELIAAFTAIDENDDGMISFDEFKTWWSGSNATGPKNIV